MPSHAALFTGLLPRASGISRVVDGSPTALAPLLQPHADRVLPEVLRRAGYETAAISTNLWISEMSGFGTGFERFESIDTGRQGGLHSDRLRSRVKWDLEAVRARVDDGARAAGRLLETWIEDRPSETPFFWFVNLVECHSPYLPPKPYNDLGALDRMRAAEEARQFLTLESIWRACAGALEVPEPALERMRRLYAAAVRSMDDWLARILESLDAQGLLDETLVMVISDHGENFGENSYMGHSFSLDDRLIRVPVIAAGPGAPADGALTNLSQVPRTIADACGLEAHPWHEDFPAGVGLAQFDPPGPIEHPRWQEKIAEWGVTSEIGRRVATPLTAATDGDYKLMLRGEREELYDLAADPLELDPLPPRSRPEATEAVALLRAALEHPANTARAAAPGPDIAPPVEADDEELAQLEERMKLLGYM